MNTTTPEKSPSADDPPSEEIQSHTTSIRQEAWRGAKYGAKVCTVIYICIMSFAIYLASTKGEPVVEFPDDLFGKIKMAGVLFAQFLYFTWGFGAVPGAIVMALATWFRKRRN